MFTCLFVEVADLPLNKKKMALLDQTLTCGATSLSLIQRHRPLPFVPGPLALVEDDREWDTP